MFKKIGNDAEKLFGIIMFDIQVTLSALFLSLFVLLSIIPHKEGDNVEIGSVCAELYWDNNRDVDLDLWGLSPVDKNPVGYNNTHGQGLDLFRDVIGFQFNPEHVNMEVMCSNHLYPGEWTFDVFFFSDHEDLKDGHDQAIKATMIVRVKTKDNTYTLAPMKTSFVLHGENEEKTLFDFTIDKDNNVVQSSINSLDRNIARPPARTAHDRYGKVK
jgi:hypothetical protein